jgi:hypothetical protein
MGRLGIGFVHVRDQTITLKPEPEAQIPHTTLISSVRLFKTWVIKSGQRFDFGSQLSEAIKVA